MQDLKEFDNLSEAIPVRFSHDLDIRKGHSGALIISPTSVSRSEAIQQKDTHANPINEGPNDVSGSDIGKILPDVSQLTRNGELSQGRDLKTDYSSWTLDELYSAKDKMRIEMVQDMQKTGSDLVYAMFIAAVTFMFPIQLIN